MVRITSDMSMRDRIIFSSVRDPEGCWRWMKAKYANGYGSLKVRVNGRPKNFLAHRVSYEAFIGPVPQGLTIDHLCRIRDCVNPFHMEVVTQRENTLRGIGPSALHAQKTHCPRGHAYDLVVQIGNRETRRCKQCIAVSQHKTYMKHREARLEKSRIRYQELTGVKS